MRPNLPTLSSPKTKRSLGSDRALNAHNAHLLALSEMRVLRLQRWAFLAESCFTIEVERSAFSALCATGLGMVLSAKQKISFYLLTGPIVSRQVRSVQNVLTSMGTNGNYSTISNRVSPPAAFIALIERTRKISGIGE